jgi:class 3 adenylate cyclase/tetratricopeptide (TPR) repeat protein
MPDASIPGGWLMTDRAAGPRQLTVMFCDVVGWTSLAQRTDAEALQAMARRYRERCAAIIDRHGGFVAQYFGDGVLSYFGYPGAHEDDAERAVRAAREIASSDSESSAGLQVHIGIATGWVVVGLADDPSMLVSRAAGDRGGGDVSAFGEAPNLAARLLELALPGSIVVSNQTRRLCGAAFEYRDLGLHPLKGFSEPVPAWQVLAEGHAPSRFHALRAIELTPMVNRTAELQQITKLWQLAKDGHGVALLISGEAGIGKSRLVDEVSKQIVDSGSLRLRYFCSSHLQNSPLAPLIRQLPRVAGFREHDDVAAKLHKLGRFSAATALDPNEVVPLLATVLSIPYEHVYPPLGMSPQRQRSRLFEVLIDLLATSAASRPALFVVEDLHWIDPSSDELVAMVVDAAKRLPIMVIITTRPDFQPHWRGREHLIEMRLGTLDRQNSLTMIGWLCRDRSLASATVEAIANRSDGLPLFIEDLTRDVLEFAAQQGVSDNRSARDSRAVRIPATLQDSLMSRLDRMGSAKRVAQIAAVLGREFSYRLLSLAVGGGAESLNEHLQRLVGNGLFEPRFSASVPTYAFRHALVCDAAYSSLSKKEQIALHARVAEILAQEFPEIVERQPELLAHHLQIAGDLDRAVSNWVDAARLSARRSGFLEAIAQLDGALGLSALHPDTRSRWQLELRVQLVLGGIYAEYRGFSSAECGRAYARALELCQQLGDTPQVYAAIAGAGSFEITRGNLVESRALAEQCLAMAARQQSAAPFVMGHLLLGGTLFLNGEFAASRRHLDAALRAYDEDRPSRKGKQVLYVQEQRSTGLCYLALTLTIMGYLEEGLHAARDGVLHARSLGALHAENFSLCYLAGVHSLRREMDGALRVATESLEMARKQGFASWRGVSQLIRGEAIVSAGFVAEGLAEIVAGRAAHTEMGAVSYQTFTTAVFARGLLAAGRIDEALVALDDGLASGERRNERFCFAELFRLKANAFSARNQIAEAERWLLESIEVARRQEAKLFELRGAIDLCKLAPPDRRRSIAHDTLGPLCDWFGSATDLPDLTEASGLLASLS